MISLAGCDYPDIQKPALSGCWDESNLAVVKNISQEIIQEQLVDTGFPKEELSSVNIGITLTNVYAINKNIYAKSLQCGASEAVNIVGKNPSKSVYIEPFNMNFDLYFGTKEGVVSTVEKAPLILSLNKAFQKKLEDDAK